MPLTLYYHPVSPPCRTVLLTAKHLGLELDLKLIDVQKGEHMKEDFVKINPQHCIPTLVDDDLVLWESRAIIKYLAAQYSKNGFLYPSDPAQRAKIDKLLYFDVGTLYSRFSNFAYPALFLGEKADPSKEEKVKEAIGFLDHMLEGHFFAMSNRITIADHALSVSVSTIKEMGIDIKDYQNVSAWLVRCQHQMPGYKEHNQEPSIIFAKFGRTKLRT